MTTLTEFLLARIAEDEAVARDASVDQWGQEVKDASDWVSLVQSVERDSTAAQDELVRRHDPARILRECEAKREVIAHYEAYAREAGRNPDVFALVKMSEAVEGILVELAKVHSDHPDFRDEWR